MQLQIQLNIVNKEPRNHLCIGVCLKKEIKERMKTLNLQTLFTT